MKSCESEIKKYLDQIYRKFNRRNFVHPDPLEFLFNYEDARDREVVGLVASTLAYGKVAQILKSVSAVLEKMGPSPRKFLLGSDPEKIRGTFGGFKHRFTTGRDFAGLLIGIRAAIKKFGSLNYCFLAGYNDKDEDVYPAIFSFISNIWHGGGDHKGMFPVPGGKSACKRVNLYLRWMVRKDDVDPGGWEGVPQSKLIVPLDTHMHKIGRKLGFTSRKAADQRTAREITHAFSKLVPKDPVKYDFALTRFGIRDELSLENLFCGRHKTLANRAQIG